MRRAIVGVLALTGSVAAAQFDVTLSQMANYRGWGWGAAYVMANDIVTLAVMPQIGGRAMQYDLGSHPFLRVDLTKTGQLPPTPPTPTTTFDGGGFMTWPAPQDNWGAVWGNWPPPPYLAHGPYNARLLTSSADSVSVEVTSAVEQLTAAAGLVFRKIYTLYKNTTKVRIEHRMINNATQNKTWSVREVAQVWPTPRVGSAERQIWLFFPKGSSPKDSAKGYWTLNAESSFANQLTTDIVPGVVGFNYRRIGGQIAAHPTSQWIANVDESDSSVFVQKAHYDPRGTYPEYGGAVIIVWAGRDWAEAEFCTPQKNMAPNDSSVFVSVWYATKLAGPIATVNDAGAVGVPLAVNASTGTVTGRYGVFHRGTVKLFFDGQSQEARQFAVTPTAPFALNETVGIPAQSGSAALLLYDMTGAFVDTLDAVKFREVSVARASYGPDAVVLCMTDNGRGTLSLTCRDGAHLTIRTLDGRVVMRRTNLLAGTNEVSLETLTAGTYVVSAEWRGVCLVRRLTVRR